MPWRSFSRVAGGILLVISFLATTLHLLRNASTSTDSDLAAVKLVSSEGANPSPITRPDLNTSGMVHLLFMGRLGNNLFEYAAARYVADKLGWPLTLEAAPGNKIKFSTLLMAKGMKCFPGIRPVGPVLSEAHLKKLKVKPFRRLEEEISDRDPRIIHMQNWYQDYDLFSADEDRLRQIMALNPQCCGPTAPGPNDLVVHYRNYKKELTDEQYSNLHFKDLSHEFYATVLGDVALSAAGSPETVWVVGECEANDPFVLLLSEEHDNVKKAEMVEDQFSAFCFLTRASRLVMAHSTFSWWAAFLGNATEVHFPLSKPRQGVTVASIAVTGDARYTYRDESGQVVPPPTNHRR